MSIPKIIHYFWVGGTPKPPEVRYCIESWKRFCPEYEIREWNESNYDFSKNVYMKQAYEAKKWGFVPDYARLDIIYKYGGIYLDTDVELLSNFDELLEEDGFMGFEATNGTNHFVACGLGFGAVPHNKIIKEARDIYEKVYFIHSDGSLNLTPSPYYTTMVLRRIGLKNEDSDQSLPGMKVFASDVFCPKEYFSGNLKKTNRTLSIHHYSASWVDERIRKELAHHQKLERIFGKRTSKKVLYAESVFEKYRGRKMLSKLPKRAAFHIRRKIAAGKDAAPYYIGIIRASFEASSSGTDILLDTAMLSENLGDSIIMESCLSQLSECIDVEKTIHVSTHCLPSPDNVYLLHEARQKILCGTNVLSGKMRNYGLWKLGSDVSPYKNTLLMGVGFDSLDPSFDKYSKWLFHVILSKKGYHSVRDQFSEKKLKAMGIMNVLYTGCPTMWELTPDHCSRIPASQGQKVLTTVTDYCRDPELDKAMLEILLENYSTVYLWIQGRGDLNYIDSLGYLDRLLIVDGGLPALDKVLSNNGVDYVGTRLHAGIRAIRAGRRSLIVSIDNRAACIGSDTGLPVINREEVPYILADRIRDLIFTQIDMPWNNIKKWKNQFLELVK